MTLNKIVELMLKINKNKEGNKSILFLHLNEKNNVNMIESDIMIYCIKMIKL